MTIFSLIWQYPKKGVVPDKKITVSLRKKKGLHGPSGGWKSITIRGGGGVKFVLYVEQVKKLRCCAKKMSRSLFEGKFRATENRLSLN